MLNQNRILVFLFISLVLVGCEGTGISVDNNRLLHNQLELGTEWIEISLEPALEVENQVQYIALSLPEANLWKSGVKSPNLIMPDGKTISIEVDLQTDSDKRFELRSVSFGSKLMFSHLSDDYVQGQSDLPKGEKITRLLLKSNQPITIDEVHWIDITNK